jgi:hypothetical protein
MIPISIETIKITKNDFEIKIKKALEVQGFKNYKYKVGDISNCILNNLLEKGFAFQQEDGFFCIQRDLSIGVRTELTASISQCSAIPANAAHAVLESICPLS